MKNMKGFTEKLKKKYICEGAMEVWFIEKLQGN